MDLEYRLRLEKRFNAEIRARFAAQFNIPKDAGYGLAQAELIGAMRAFDVALKALSEEANPAKQGEQVEPTNPYID